MLTPRGRNQGFEHGGGNLSNLFIEHPIARQSLIPTLVQFFIDIEITGSHRRKIYTHTYTCVYMCTTAISIIMEGHETAFNGFEYQFTTGKPLKDLKLTLSYYGNGSMWMSDLV